MGRGHWWARVRLVGIRAVRVNRTNDGPDGRGQFDVATQSRVLHKEPQLFPQALRTKDHGLQCIDERLHIFRLKASHIIPPGYTPFAEHLFNLSFRGRTRKIQQSNKRSQHGCGSSRKLH